MINSKKNNCFVAELGKEFMFYSAFVRSFDSSFGKVLEKIGKGFCIVFDQYRKSAEHIKKALERIKALYFRPIEE